MATSTLSHAGIALAEQDLHCFVCDAVVIGRYYTLATCRTQNSKVRLIEKLGQLVGERYMVVISEDDIICRGCATLINTLDRLESEMSTVRAVVLRFLEKKYSLEDGELVNSKPTGAPAPPPQITPAANSQGRDKDVNRKRKSASSDGDSDAEFTDGKKKDPKSNMWMQCNKCKYTTDYHAFMVHHVQHKKKAAAAAAEKNHNKESSNNASLPGAVEVTSIETITSVADPSKQTIKRFKTENLTESDPIQSEFQNSQPKKDLDSETVEMIAAEINEFRNNSNPTSSANEKVITAVSQHSSTNKNSTLVMTHPGTTLATGGDGEEMTVLSAMVVEGDESHQGVTNLEETTICMMPISDEGTGERQAILEETGEGGVYVHVVDMGDQDVHGIVEVAREVAHHEDGTVEMVEVMWDQMVTNEDDGDGTQEINF